jgi:hypothetical protein
MVSGSIRKRVRFHLDVVEAIAKGMKKQAVLLVILIQDPTVAGETEVTRILHHLIVKDPAGFTEGPACRRVAVVDLDFHTGKLRAPTGFSPRPTYHPDFTAYDVVLPMKQGTLKLEWMDGFRRGGYVTELGSIAPDDHFMKESLFGSVLRTIVIVQGAAILGREIEWAFPGKQLLVVPRAAEMDNAFYHRDSHSLQFYYGAKKDGTTVYSALSQDIIVHETAHAIIDGIAPDLYDAISPESLAIHEGVADLTAAMVSMRNRDLTGKRGQPINTKEYQASSRFSRIAEEFGRWLGHGNSLRDICNTKSLDPRAAEDCRIDSTSPHSTSQVVSGLLFNVFSAVFEAATRNSALKLKKKEQLEYVGLARQLDYACSRTLGLAYRGLDWLPPGDATIGDFVAAMLAADLHFFPNDLRTRKVLAKEARLRKIPLGQPVEFVKRVRIPGNGTERLKFVDRYRKAFGIPATARVKVTVRTIHIYEPPLRIPRHERFDLTPDMSRRTSAKTEHRLIKLAWWQLEENDLHGWGTHRRYRTGATIVTDKSGRVIAVLQQRHTATTTSSRSGFLRLMLTGERTPQIGPDGIPLQRGLRTSVKNNTLSITGTMQALHVVGDFE